MMSEENLIEIYSCNLKNNRSVDRVCHKVIKKYGYPDFIINNAASLDLKNLDQHGISSS